MLGRWMDFIFYWQNIFNFKIYAIFCYVIVWNIYHVVVVFLLNLAHIAVKLDIYRHCYRVLWNLPHIILWAWMAVMTTFANVCYPVLIWNLYYSMLIIRSFDWWFQYNDHQWEYSKLLKYFVYYVFLRLVSIQPNVSVKTVSSILVYLRVQKVSPETGIQNCYSTFLINFTVFCLPVLRGWCLFLLLMLIVWCQECWLQMVCSLWMMVEVCWCGIMYKVLKVFFSFCCIFWINPFFLLWNQQFFLITVIFTSDMLHV